MNAAPFNWAKRNAVRATMLKHDAILSGRIVFRFVIGDLLIPKAPRSKGILRGEPSETRWSNDKSALAREIASYRDIVQLDAIDGPGVAMECPAAEKTIQFIRFALRSWPSALYYGKTEDDTYVSVGALELELTRLFNLRLPNVLYGLFGVCAMPNARRAERTAAGYKACFLGSFERIGWITGGYRALVEWRQGGGAARRQKAKCAPGSTEPAPFPTGPLMIASASLATAVFSSCTYLDRFLARESNVAYIECLPAAIPLVLSFARSIRQNRRWAGHKPQDAMQRPRQGAFMGISRR